MSDVSEHSDSAFYFPKKKKKKEKPDGHMIKCLLTELGRAGRENIWRSVRTPWPRAKYFPVRPSYSVNKYILWPVADNFDLSTQLPCLKMRASLRLIHSFSHQYNKVTYIHLPPFKQGRWHTGLWHWFPLQSAEHVQTLGLTHFPPLKHGNLHTGNRHRSPIYPEGHLHRFPNKHNPPFWHLGEQGAEKHRISVNFQWNEQQIFLACQLCFPNTDRDDTLEVWTFVVFINKTACEHENFQLLWSLNCKNVRLKKSQEEGMRQRRVKRMNG